MDAFSDDEIKEKTEELAAMIRDSETYGEYIEQRKRIGSQPELYAQVNAYRKKNYELQNSPQTDDLFDRVTQFEKEFSEFRKDPLVDAFLRAELALCRLMQEMQNIISGNIDFDMHSSENDSGTNEEPSGE